MGGSEGELATVGRMQNVFYSMVGDVNRGGGRVCQRRKLRLHKEEYNFNFLCAT